MRKVIHQTSALVLFLLLCAVQLIAADQDQKAKKRTARLSINYIQDYDAPGKLVANLKVREKRYEALVGVPALLYAIQAADQVPLDTVITNRQGEAEFIMNRYRDLFVDSTGVITCLVTFEGDSATKPTDRKIEFKRAKLDVLFYQSDSVKFIEIAATELDPEGKSHPIEGLDVQFSIKGLFSLLPFEKATTDAAGKATVEFPTYMPGDTAGVLTIVAHIDDHDEYGTIKSAGSMNWARVVPLPVEEHRGLGDTDAPLWMVYTLIILLSAVWFHYLYVTWQVIKIKLVGKGVL